jgi:TonB family protein
MKARTMRVAALAGMLALAQSAAAQSAAAQKIQDRLTSLYVGKMLTLRDFYQAEVLHYDRGGNLVGAGEEGPWTLYGKVEITQVAVKSDQLELTANRMFHVYDAQGHAEIKRSNLTVRVEAELNPDTLNENTVNLALSRIFLTNPQQQLPGAAPDYWRAFLSGRGADAIRANYRSPSAPTDRIIVRKEQKELVCVACTQPEYPTMARGGQIQGEVVFVALINEEGTVETFHIIQPLGLGLDEAAAEAVRQWQFEPILYEGFPVAGWTELTVKYLLREQPQQTQAPPQ